MDITKWQRKMSYRSSVTMNRLNVLKFFALERSRPSTPRITRRARANWLVSLRILCFVLVVQKWVSYSANPRPAVGFSPIGPPFQVCEIMFSWRIL